MSAKSIYWTCIGLASITAVIALIVEHFKIRRTRKAAEEQVRLAEAHRDAYLRQQSNARVFQPQSARLGSTVTRRQASPRSSRRLRDEETDIGAVEHGLDLCLDGVEMLHHGGGE